MVVVEIGFRKYVMDTEKAVKVAELLTNAEMYERTYIPEEKRVDSDVEYIHHIWHAEETVQMRVISDHLYRAAKLTGKKD